MPLIIDDFAWYHRCRTVTPPERGGQLLCALIVVDPQANGRRVGTNRRHPPTRRRWINPYPHAIGPTRSCRLGNRIPQTHPRIIGIEPDGIAGKAVTNVGAAHFERLIEGRKPTIADVAPLGIHHIECGQCRLIERHVEVSQRCESISIGEAIIANFEPGLVARRITSWCHRPPHQVTRVEVQFRDDDVIEIPAEVVFHQRSIGARLRRPNQCFVTRGRRHNCTEIQTLGDDTCAWPIEIIRPTPLQTHF